MKTAIVHIGAHKTGTTSIQMSLSKSQDRLTPNGVSYFNDYDRGAQMLSRCFRSQGQKELPAESKYPTFDAMKRASRSAWIRLAKQARRERGEFVVISEEDLLRLPHPENLEDLLRRFFDHIVIVAYVRDPIARLPSGIDQKIRGGSTLAELVNAKFLVPRFVPKLNAYATAFGESNLIVRNFDMGNLVNASPVSDFAAVLSRISQCDIKLADVGRFNTGMPAAVVCDFLEENEGRAAVGATKDRAAKLRRSALIKAVRDDAWLMTKPKLRLSDPKLIGHLQQLHATDIEEINTRFLTGQTLIDPGQPGDVLPPMELALIMQSWFWRHRDTVVSERMARLRAGLYQSSLTH